MLRPSAAESVALCSTLAYSERFAIGARVGLGATLERPTPMTSTGSVLAPLEVPCQGTTTYSSPPPADVRQTPSLMLTLIAWPTERAVGDAEPRHGETSGLATTT